MPMTPKEMIKYLKKNGFKEIRQNGSHITMKNRDSGKTVIVPYHSKSLKKGLEQAILKQAGLKQMEVLCMEKLFYPAIFHKAEEGGFWISFPDLPECFTEGDDMKQAYEMAVEALGLALVNRKEEKEEIPMPSEIDKIQNEDGIFVVIEFDMQEYLRKHNAKAVKKTLSIPQWLNEEATAMGINFSQVLQEALMNKLNIGR